jgi:hypothetical protein
VQPQETVTRRIGALAGVAFVALLFCSTAMVDAPRGATDAELLSWWSDDGNLTNVLVSTYLQVGAGVCFLLFAIGLRAALMAREDGSRPLSTLAFVAAVVFVALLLASDGPRGVIAAGVKLNDEALPAPDFLRYMPQLGYVLLGTIGGVVAGVSTAAASLVIVRTGAIGRWSGMLGLLCAAVIVVAAVALGPWFIPMFLVWVLASSAALWRSAGSTSSRTIEQGSAELAG